MYRLLLLFLGIALLPSISAQEISVTVPPDSLVIASDSIIAKMKADDQFVDDEAANNYLREIVREITGASGYDPDLFEVFIDKSLIINAAVYPNATIVVSSGLILRMSTREELSFVIGHELSHYLLGHFNVARPDELKEIALQSLIKEYEADSLGVALMTAAKQPAKAAATALEKLPPAFPTSWSFIFFKIKLAPGLLSHPPTPRRVERVLRQAELTAGIEYQISDDYYSELEGIRNATRYSLLNTSDEENQWTTLIITIDSIVKNIPDDNASDYINQLYFQQSEAILSLMRTHPTLAISDIKRAEVRFSYRNDDLEKEANFYKYDLAMIFGNEGLEKVHELFADKLLANIDRLSQTKNYALEAKRHRGLYLERLGLYVDARHVLTEYLAGNPTHPSRRFAKSLVDGMPKKNRKEPRY